LSQGRPLGGGEGGILRPALKESLGRWC